MEPQKKPLSRAEKTMTVLGIIQVIIGIPQLLKD